jgi:hypothetical protein
MHRKSKSAAKLHHVATVRRGQGVSCAAFNPTLKHNTEATKYAKTVNQPTSVGSPIPGLHRSTFIAYGFWLVRLTAKQNLDHLFNCAGSVANIRLGDWQSNTHSQPQHKKAVTWTSALVKLPKQN